MNYLKKKAWQIINALGYSIRKAENFAFDDIRKLTTSAETRIVFDCGCNNGSVIREFKGLFPAAKIYGFEPLPDVAEKAKVKFADDPMVEIHQVALSDRNGRVNFHRTTAADSSSLLQGNLEKVPNNYARILEQADIIEVESLSLDAFMEKSGVDHIDLLKMDVQGAELSILKGAEKALSGGLIKVIYSEVFFLPFYKDQPLFGEIAAYLCQFGYRIFYPYNLVFGSKSGRLQWGDVIFVRGDIKFDKDVLFD